MKYAACLSLLIATVASAGQFTVSKSTMEVPENGTIATMVVLTDTHKFSFVPPYDCTSAVKQKEQKIDFASATGKLAISLQVTATFAGHVPDEAELRKHAAQLYPGTGVLQVGGAIASSGVGSYVDVLRIFPNGARMTTRHAFCPLGAQTLEVVMTTDAASFEKQRSSFGALLNSFKVEPRS